MSQKHKLKSPLRGQRHSAAWGKRLSMVLLVLIAQFAFADNGKHTKFAQDLAPALARAHQGTAGVDTVNVIVQYEKVPQAKHEARMKTLGGNLKHRLGMVKALALTIPVSAGIATLVFYIFRALS